MPGKVRLTELCRTYNDIFVDIRNVLRDMEIYQSSLEARLLLSSASGKSKEELTRDMPLKVSKEIEDIAKSMLKRRRHGEPLAYITGEWEFYGLPIKVTRDVLIPRMDTEVAVTVAIEEALKLGAGGRVLDLCCGSGCIGIALAANTQNTKVTLADISNEALKVAKGNVTMNNLGGRVTCVQTNVLETPRPFLGNFDIIVSNPPYIPTDDIAALDDSVKEFEPSLALDGGRDGMEYYRNIALVWKRIIKPGGCLIFECGIGQSALVEYLLRANEFEDIEKIRDSGGIERVVVGRMPDDSDDDTNDSEDIKDSLESGEDNIAAEDSYSGNKNKNIEGSQNSGER